MTIIHAVKKKAKHYLRDQIWDHAVQILIF